MKAEMGHLVDVNEEILTLVIEVTYWHPGGNIMGTISWSGIEGSLNSFFLINKL